MFRLQEALYSIPILCARRSFLKTMTIGEGRDLIEAVEASGKTFLTGLEERSLVRFHKLVEWVRDGAIDELYHMDVTSERVRSLHLAEAY